MFKFTRPTALDCIRVCTLLSTCWLLTVGCTVDVEPTESLSSELSVPARGSSTTLDIASWNIEWFGDTANGPSDENLQLTNARDIIQGTDFDLWGVAEIVSSSSFSNLKSGLSGYSGVLASDSNVTSGSSYYSASEQKVGILYKSNLFSFQSAKIILTSNDYDFANRPPLEVKLNATLNGVTEALVVIVLHAKAFDDTSSWQRRQNAAVALKSYLDSTYPTQKLIVIGDYNDDVDTSITPSQSSPYQNFVTDSARYTFPTKSLSEAGESSTTGYSDMIDHHLTTNELYATYVSGSAAVFELESWVSNYDASTSDHYPVLTRYNWSGTTATSATLRINEIRANEPGSDTALEFVELVNVGTASADLGGFTLSDGSSVRHTFASGTSLAAGGAIVVFGAASGLPSGTTNAVAASTAALSLSNSGDSVVLKNTSGSVLDSYTYSSTLASSDGVSMNRSPDGGSSGGFVLHTTLSGSSSSAGLRASGSSW